MSDRTTPQGPTSMVVVRIGDREFPAKTSATCRTCQHPRRADIERWYLTGYRAKAILKEIGDQESALGPLTEKALRHHCGNHLPIEATTQAAILERRAAELGDAIGEYGDRVADGPSALKVLIASGFDKAVAGQMAMSATDLVAAISMLHKIESSMEGEATSKVWRTALMRHMSIARKWIPAADLSAFAREISEDPVLRALAEEMHRQQNQPRALT